MTMRRWSYDSPIFYCQAQCQFTSYNEKRYPFDYKNLIYFVPQKLDSHYVTRHQGQVKTIFLIWSSKKFRNSCKYPLLHIEGKNAVVYFQSMFYQSSWQITTNLTSALWKYGLWSFQTGGTKLERFLPKNQHTQRKFLNFENWTKGEPQ